MHSTTKITFGNSGNHRLRFAAEAFGPNQPKGNPSGAALADPRTSAAKRTPPGSLPSFMVTTAEDEAAAESLMVEASLRWQASEKYQRRIAGAEYRAVLAMCERINEQARRAGARRLAALPPRNDDAAGPREAARAPEGSPEGEARSAGERSSPVRAGVPARAARGARTHDRLEALPSALDPRSEPIAVTSCAPPADENSATERRASSLDTRVTTRRCVA
jgi:hypothetical protein